MLQVGRTGQENGFDVPDFAVHPRHWEFIGVVGSASDALDHTNRTHVLAVVDQQTARHIVDCEIVGGTGFGEGFADQPNPFGNREIAGFVGIVHNGKNNLVEQPGRTQRHIDVAQGDRVVGARADDLHSPLLSTSHSAVSP